MGDLAFVDQAGNVGQGRAELLERVWDMPAQIKTRAPDQFIRRLRKTFEPRPEQRVGGRAALELERAAHEETRRAFRSEGEGARRRTAELERQLAAARAEAGPPPAGTIRALVAPHAGYAYSGATAPAAPGPPNVLLVSLDTLRADHLSSYGYHRHTTPFLDELAAGGTRFSHASVNTHGTPSSHTTGVPAWQVPALHVSAPLQ